MEQKYIYVVFASTPYKIGRMIRKITGETYNHACIALDSNLEQMYGFARRYYRTPFYGGFVKESVSRYHINGRSADIRVCRFPITPEQSSTLESHLKEMLRRQDTYLYNHLSALTLPFRRRVSIRDAYICVDFVVDILHSVGIPLDAKTNYSVGELEALLRPYTVYTGPAPEAKVYDTTYFAPNPVPHPVITTALAFFELVERLFE